MTRGRRKATAPRGRVTLEQAAELAGMSKAAVQQRVWRDVVPARTEPDGVVTIARADVNLIQPREPSASGGRKAVMLRPDLERYTAWKRAAGDQPVSSWLAELADAASGWTG